MIQQITNKNGYAKLYDDNNILKTNVDNDNSDTTYTNKHACTQLDVLFFITCHTHIGSSRLFSLSFHPHTIHDERFSLSCSNSLSTSPRTSSFFYRSSPCTPIIFTSSLPTIRSRSQVSEPNDMELISDTELNDSVPSKFTDFQESLVHSPPSSDHDVDDKTLGKLLDEVHRDYADYRCLEGVCVSPSSMSFMVDLTETLVE